MSSLWDVPGFFSAPAAVPADNQVILARYRGLLQHPSQFRLRLAGLIMGCGVLEVFLLPSLFGGTQLILFPLLAFLGISFYYRSVRSMEQSMAMLAVADRCGWTYDADCPATKTTDLMKGFPDVFRTDAAHGQSLANQLWGTAQPLGIPFWSAESSYTVGNGKGAQSFTTALFAIRLSRPAAADFGLATRILPGYLTRYPQGDVTTESGEFNESFSIFHLGDRNQVGEGIFETLSPPMQERLIALNKSLGSFWLSFHQDCALLALFGEPISLKYTNFFRTVGIDPRDEDAFQQRTEGVVCQLAGAVSRID